MNEESMYQNLMVNNRDRVYRYMKIRNIQSLSNSAILSDILSTKEGRYILYANHWAKFPALHIYNKFFITCRIRLLFSC